MRVCLILLLGAAAPCLAAACSSTPSPDAAPTPRGDPTSTAAGSGAAAEVPRGEFAARLAKVICDANGPCCAATGAVHEKEHCAAQVVDSLGWNEYVGKAKSYDGKSAARCLDDVRAVAAKCSAARDEVLGVASCAAAFAGSRKTGEACEDNGDCAPPPRGHAFCWTGASGEAKGRCAASVPPEKGAACFTPLGKEDTKQLVFSECNDDSALRCDPATNTCGPRLKAGASCEQHYECEEGALCYNRKCKPTAGTACKAARDCAVHQTCTDGKCGPGKKLGEGCGSLTECAEGLCAANTNRCSSWAASFLCKAPPR